MVSIAEQATMGGHDLMLGVNQKPGWLGMAWCSHGLHQWQLV